MNTIIERENQLIQDPAGSPHDQTGALAESARRHLAYERLARQVAASEAAARPVLSALGARPRDTSGGGPGPVEGAHE